MKVKCHYSNHRDDWSVT